MMNFIELWKIRFARLKDDAVTWLIMGGLTGFLLVDFFTDDIGFSAYGVLLLLFSLVCYFTGFTIGVFLGWRRLNKEN